MGEPWGWEWLPALVAGVARTVAHSTYPAARTQVRAEVEETVEAAVATVPELVCTTLAVGLAAAMLTVAAGRRPTGTCPLVDLLFLCWPHL